MGAGWKGRPHVHTDRETKTQYIETNKGTGKLKSLSPFPPHAPFSQPLSTTRAHTLSPPLHPLLFLAQYFFLLFLLFLRILTFKKRTLNMDSAYNINPTRQRARNGFLHASWILRCQRSFHYNVLLDARTACDKKVRMNE